MIDTTVDPDLAAFERVQALREAKAQYARRKASEAQGGSLAARPRTEDARESTGELAVEAEATVLVPPPEPRPAPDPLAHLRLARFGLVAVVALALLAFWIHQKRADVRGRPLS